MQKRPTVLITIEMAARRYVTRVDIRTTRYRA